MSRLHDLALKNQSYRRFDESRVIPYETFVEPVNLARWVASSANRPSLNISSLPPEKQTPASFPVLAGQAIQRNGRVQHLGCGQSAYIVILMDRRIAKGCSCDDGIAAPEDLSGLRKTVFAGCIIERWRLKRWVVTKTFSTGGIRRAFTVSPSVLWPSWCYLPKRANRKEGRFYGSSRVLGNG